MADDPAQPHARKTGLTQDPHAVADPQARQLEAAIGHSVRTLRKARHLTVAELAKATGVSVGMLSKIENGHTSPSLTTLQGLAAALSVPITALFRSFEDRRGAVLVKNGQGLSIHRRGSRAGHHYSLLGHLDRAPDGVVVEPYLITLTEESDIFPTFQHAGLEFIYMLEGRISYRHGGELFELAPGDALFFEADAPHGPDVLTELPARFLSIISYNRATDKDS